MLPGQRSTGRLSKSREENHICWLVPFALQQSSHQDFLYFFIGHPKVNLVTKRGDNPKYINRGLVKDYTAAFGG